LLSDLGNWGEVPRPEDCRAIEKRLSFQSFWMKFERNFDECADGQIIDWKCFVMYSFKTRLIFVSIFLFRVLYSMFYVLYSMFYVAFSFVICDLWFVICDLWFVICDDRTKLIAIERITIKIEIKSWRTNFVCLFYDLLLFINLLIYLRRIFI
jgi:hypothetical protein